MLTRKQLAAITREQIAMQKRFRAVPETGIIVPYLGKEFLVYPHVFWPFDDSQPLVENYHINPGDEVVDVCTGSGVIAVFSAYKGAKKVVAVDINPAAVENARANARLHGFEDTIEVRLSDMFDAVREEQFDVITGNLPFRDLIALDNVELSQWDTNLRAHRRFFAGVDHYLKANGRIYLSQANFGAVEEMKQMAEAAGFNVRLISEKALPPRIFYAFELIRKW